MKERRKVSQLRLTVSGHLPRSIIGLLLLVSCATQGFAQGLHAEGKRIVNDKGENVLLRGIGLGGWMLQEGYMLKINRESQQHRIRERIEELIGPKQTQEFYDLWLANHTRRIDVDSLHAWGFNSIRLPMHFNLYTLPVDKEPVAGQNTWLDKGFAMTDSLLAWCKANRMYLILDLHAAPGGQGNDLNISDRDPAKPSLWESDANRQKTVALWRKLAERYKDEPWIGGYDILNEPNWGFADQANDRNGLKEKTNAPLQSLLKDITAAIRSVDTKHLIIIEGNGWGNNYSGIEPTWDRNMALSFHKYWNYNDAGSIGGMLAMRDKFNMPIWLGETGENSNVWFSDAVRLFESNNVGWAWWPLKKIGFNNPMEIRSNINYDNLVNYLNGRPGARKPKESDVYSGLMELATYTRLESTVRHRDVIDALFRQPFTTETKPFKPNDVGKRATINAVDFDLGRNGYAYFDTDTADYHVATGKTTPGNRGRMYRNDGVDIRRDSTKYESYYVSDMETGEWLQYTVNVARKGTYQVTLLTAAQSPGSRLSVSTDMAKTPLTVAVPASGSDRTFIETAPVRLSLPAGKQVLRVHVDNGGCNFAAIRLERR